MHAVQGVEVPQPLDVASSFVFGSNLAIENAAREAREKDPVLSPSPSLAPINIVPNMHRQKPSMAAAPTPTFLPTVVPKKPGYSSIPDFATGMRPSSLPTANTSPCGESSECSRRRQWQPESNLIMNTAPGYIHWDSPRSGGVRPQPYLHSTCTSWDRALHERLVAQFRTSCTQYFNHTVPFAFGQTVILQTPLHVASFSEKLSS
jgi:hypothetical protein